MRGAASDSTNGSLCENPGIISVLNPRPKNGMNQPFIENLNFLYMFSSKYFIKKGYTIKILVILNEWANHENPLV